MRLPFFLAALVLLASAVASPRGAPVRVSPGHDGGAPRNLPTAANGQLGRSVLGDLGMAPGSAHYTSGSTRKPGWEEYHGADGVDHGFLRQSSVAAVAEKADTDGVHGLGSGMDVSGVFRRPAATQESDEARSSEHKDGVITASTSLRHRPVKGHHRHAPRELPRFTTPTPLSTIALGTTSINSGESPASSAAFRMSRPRPGVTSDSGIHGLPLVCGRSSNPGGLISNITTATCWASDLASPSGICGAYLQHCKGSGKSGGLISNPFNTTTSAGFSGHSSAQPFHDQPTAFASASGCAIFGQQSLNRSATYQWPQRTHAPVHSSFSTLHSSPEHARTGVDAGVSAITVTQASTLVVTVSEVSVNAPSTSTGSVKVATPTSSGASSQTSLAEVVSQPSLFSVSIAAAASGVGVSVMPSASTITDSTMSSSLAMSILTTSEPSSTVSQAKSNAAEASVSKDVKTAITVTSTRCESEIHIVYLTVTLVVPAPATASYGNVVPITRGSWNSSVSAVAVSATGSAWLTGLSAGLSTIYGPTNFTASFPATSSSHLILMPTAPLTVPVSASFSSVSSLSSFLSLSSATIMTGDASTGIAKNEFGVITSVEETTTILRTKILTTYTTVTIQPTQTTSAGLGRGYFFI